MTSPTTTHGTPSGGVHDGSAQTYGRTKLSKLRAAVNDLRTAIRAEGTPAVQDAWDRAEPWIDRIFRP